MKYQSYKLEDFVTDPGFRNYVLGLDTTTQQFWESWMAQHPEKKELLEEARQYILALESTRKSRPQEHIEHNWELLRQRMDQSRPNKRVIGHKPIRKFWPMLAAAVIGIFILIGGYQFFTVFELQ